MTNSLYAAWLISAGGVLSKRTYKMLRAFDDPSSAYLCAISGELDGRFFTEEERRALRKGDLAAANRILESCEKHGLQIITYYDKEYPEAFRRLALPPVAIFVKGKLPDLNSDPFITVVGTRHCSEKGKKIAARLSYELSMRGISVVSGLATGIDTYAHKGCMYAGAAPTAAILACGAEKPQPASNGRIYDAILEYGGAIISEMPPDTGYFGKFSYLSRNRLLSAISHATLIVESGKSGGSLITANYALEQNKLLFAIPGALDSPNSVGTNLLIRDGALVCTGVDDIVREYEAVYGNKIKKVDREKLKQTQKQEKKKAESELRERLSAMSEDAQRLFAELKKSVHSADTLCEITGIPFPVTVAALQELEFEELIIYEDGGTYKINT